MQNVPYAGCLVSYPANPECKCAPCVRHRRPRPVDRIDQKGDIREHWTHDGERTLCGLAIGHHQAAVGNRECRRCVRLRGFTPKRCVCGHPLGNGGGCDLHLPCDHCGADGCDRCSFTGVRPEPARTAVRLPLPTPGIPPFMRSFPKSFPGVS